ncbi:MAG: HPr family phosphocarrier protein [Veillonella atypica]
MKEVTVEITNESGLSHARPATSIYTIGTQNSRPN